MGRKRKHDRKILSNRPKKVKKSTPILPHIKMSDDIIQYDYKENYLIKIAAKIKSTSFQEEVYSPVKLAPNVNNSVLHKRKYSTIKLAPQIMHNAVLPMREPKCIPILPLDTLQKNVYFSTDSALFDFRPQELKMNKNKRFSEISEGTKPVFHDECYSSIKLAPRTEPTALPSFRDDKSVPILPFATVKENVPSSTDSVGHELLSEEELAKMTENQSFSAVSEETKRAIHEECRKMLTGPFMEQKVCAVCDSWTRENLCPLREPSKDFYSRCLNRLAPSVDLPERLKRFYDISAYIPELKNALLSKQGVEEDKCIENIFRIRVCNKCYNSLKRGSQYENNNPPKFSVANGFTIGLLPKSIIDATVTEKRLTSLTNIKGHTVIARGGKHRFIKSHFIVFSSQPDVIKEGINELIKEEDKLLLIFTNPMTDAQKRATMRRYIARKGKINDLLDFYMENNALYKCLERNGTEICRLQNISSSAQSELDNVNTVYYIDDQMSAEEISENQSNIRRPTVLDSAQNPDEETIIRQDASLFTNEEATEPITTLKMATAQVIDVQQAGKLLPANSPNFFGRLFPHLFPFGYGHPDVSRNVSVSLEECVKHYLKLSSRRFSQDETFPLIAFDIVSRKRAMSHISLTCRLNPKEIEILNEVSASDLAGQLEQETRKREILKNGHNFTEKTMNHGGKRLLRRVNAVLGKTFASNEERKIYQRKAWSMAAKYHSAAMFITVTPNENGNVTVAFFAGDIKRDNLISITENDIPCNASRIEIAGRDPVSCDLFFTNILEMLIGPMIGFDMKTKLPRKQGGLFGVPKAFMGGIENQGKGTLHVHLIVFLAGFPNDADEIMLLLKTNKDFRDRMNSYIDSVIESSAINSESELECPNCCSKGTIEPTKISKIAYSRNLKFDTPPDTSKCKTCQNSFGGDVVIRHNLRRMKMQLFEQCASHTLGNKCSDAFSLSTVGSVEQYDKEEDNKVAIRSAVPRISSIPDKNSSREDLLVHAIFMIELLLLNQNHRWKHAKSCFKKSSNCKEGFCRYNFPRLANHLTQIDEFGSITGKRIVGSEYINSFNSVLLHVIRSNHDVRFLLCCAHEIYYTIKYVVKEQMTIDNIAAITIASYTKRLGKETTLKKDISAARTVYGRIASMAYARSDLVEVGAVTAVHYLLHGTTFVCSHDFQSLHLGRHLYDLDEIESDIGIIPYGNSYIAFNVTSNYTLRPLELDKTCLYDYTEGYLISKDIPKEIDSNLDCMRLHPNHPFYATRVVKRRKVKVISDIIGPRIPDLYEISDEEMEKYAKIALLLFKPYRSKVNILQQFKSFKEAFQNFKNSVQYKNSQAERILSNMQHYYIGKRRAQEMRAEQRENWALQHENPFELDSDPSSVEDDDIDDLEETSGDDEEECTPFDVQQFTFQLHPGIVERILGSLIDEININGRITNSTRKRDVCSLREMRSFVRRHVHKHISTEENEKGISYWPFREEKLNGISKTRFLSKDIAASYDSMICQDDKALNSKNMELKVSAKNSKEETVVRLLEDAIKSKRESENRYIDDNCSVKLAETINPSIDQVANRFTLNERQTIAFRIAGSYLLDSFKRSLLRYSPGKPLRMHLSGEGGTGKSRIVEAIRFLANGWGYPDAVVTVAPTGIAAVLVDGETVHSKLQILHNKKPTMKQLEEWSRVYMVIWDEISMTGQTLFSKAMKKIKAFLGTEKGCDARIHIVTAGDFAQLPPCFEKYVFSPPAFVEASTFLLDSATKAGTESSVSGSNSRKSNANVNNITGYHIWQSFKTVVKLKENMRHRSDPSYGSILKRLRTGDQTVQDFEVLNTRFLDPLCPTSEVQKQFKNRKDKNLSFPIAVQANRSRHSINWLSTSEISQNSSEVEIPIVCPAQFSATKRGAKPTMEQLEDLLKLGDNKLQRLSPLLPIFPGMRVFITQNISPKLGLANGSTGTVLGCQFPENVVFRTILVKGAPMKISSTIPEIVFVSVEQAKLKTRFSNIPEIYPSNTIPVLPYSVTVRVSCLRNRNFSIKVTQIPISPSFAATTHKLQGTTCDAILSYSVNEPGRQPTSLYVLASRVKTLEGLFLCKKLTEEDFKYFRPSQEVLDEEERLDGLCTRTLENFMNGTIFPDEVNNETQNLKRVEENDPEETIIDLYPPKNNEKTGNNVIHQSVKIPSHNTSYFGSSCFELLVPHFHSGTVMRIKSVHRFLVSCNFRAPALPITSLLADSVSRHPTLWKPVDVPGDGNCWIYATVLSIYYCTLSLGNALYLNPQDCRRKISSLLSEVSKSDEHTKHSFLRNMNLLTSRQGVALQQFSTAIGYSNSLEMLSSFLKIGTPNICLWAADIGDEMNLLSLVLNQNIISYSPSSTKTHQSTLDLNSTIGPLSPTSVYSPYPDITLENSAVPFQIPILFSDGNHFQCLIPPSDFDIFSLPSWDFNN